MPTPSVTLYGLPHCTTCQKAQAWLDQHGVTVDKFHDVKAERLSRKEIERLATLCGGPEKLFSKIARKYRALGLHEREVLAPEMLDLMKGEYTFIRRPVIVPKGGKRAVAGFSEKAVRELLGL
ncbi:MAG TPA: arsenate reductase family protein [bacterium]|nr:arsenate reductase family protein [bacterium]